MPRHDLDPSQPTLRCAIDQRHELVIPEWGLIELDGLGAEQELVTDGVGVRTNADGWTQLPNFPPPPRPLADTEGAHEWGLVSLAHDGQEEQGA